MIDHLVIRNSLVKLDLVIPVLNEESSLVTQINKVIDYFNCVKELGVDLRLIISDNGSTDTTPELAAELVEQFQGRVIYQNVPRSGVGLALKHSWGSSDADWVGYMDLDLATDLAHLKDVLSIINNDRFDLIYGSRLSKGSVVHNRTFFREVTSRIFNLILRKYLHVRLKDGMCGFKFLRRDILDSLIESGANSDGWFFCSAILVVSEYQGVRIKELPVHWSDDPNSKVKAIPLAMRYLSEMKALKVSLRTMGKV